MSRRRAIVWSLGLALAALAGLWYGDVPAAIPVTELGSEGDVPVLQRPSAARALVERGMLRYGGMPHDARLTAFSAFNHHTLISQRQVNRLDRPRCLESKKMFVKRGVFHSLVDRFKELDSARLKEKSQWNR